MHGPSHTHPDDAVTANPATSLPVVIQGGMGVGVSGWRLARAVARAGQLGVVSGVALDTLIARRLQRGDEGGHIRHALARFPDPDLAERVLRRYFVAGGIPPGTPFRPVPRLGLRSNRLREELTITANFVEVFLAKEGHDGAVGVNYLEKMQLATPAAVYGAMLAGVNYVLMGAGVPSEIPALLDALARHEPARLTVTVDGALSGERFTTGLDPARLLGPALPGPLTRPRFLAIVSAAALAAYLARDERTCPDGFVLEGPDAGGHSARPRGRMTLTAVGEPVYGPRDRIDLAKVAAIGLPFWLAGGQADAARLAAARAAGAAGIQVGTAFALCRESGLDPQLRRQILAAATDATLVVRNDAAASPTGFPFKLVHLPGTAAADDVYADRPRHCDLGYLRTPYRRPGGDVGYRCPAEPVEEYLRKGGAAGDTTGSRCLCNGLTATIGLGQLRTGGYVEPPLVTLGQDTSFLARLRHRAGADYTAADVIDHLLGAADGDA
ncbi:nitronate monooxygenase [Dactylosporangium sp. AC04546]|uniref:nitronate monooxygenase n=1 Tax=Dactylosporangium sp. AC04546 TaxID=2862460 RepID=UPI001EDD4719|nr:nitronate monooxygenase [Dactylosporangium sp. AC04546]WVK88326.1 nitronate monooxygenase [Dactylosporangium sp. AC04546]